MSRFRRTKSEPVAGKIGANGLLGRQREADVCDLLTDKHVRDKQGAGTFNSEFFGSLPVDQQVLDRGARPMFQSAPKVYHSDFLSSRSNVDEKEHVASRVTIQPRSFDPAFLYSDEVKAAPFGKATKTGSNEHKILLKMDTHSRSEANLLVQKEYEMRNSNPRHFSSSSPTHAHNSSVFSEAAPTEVSPKRVKIGPSNPFASAVTFASEPVDARSTNSVLIGVGKRVNGENNIYKNSVDVPTSMQLRGFAASEASRNSATRG